MDATRFGNRSTGRLVPVTGGKAFVPDPMPPAGWAMDDELWCALVEAKSRLMLLEGSFSQGLTAFGSFTSSVPNSVTSGARAAPAR